MSCRARLLCAVALMAIGTHAAHAQSAIAPSASATASQTANPYSSQFRPVAGPTAQDAANLPGQAGQPANVGPYQPIGVTTDQIVWYPSVTAAAFYDDNVFARHSNRQGDWAAVVRPEMAWRTNNWANMQLAGAYFVESRSYHRFDSEDQVNGGAVVGGTLRAGENTQVVNTISSRPPARSISATAGSGRHWARSPPSSGSATARSATACRYRRIIEPDRSPACRSESATWSRR